MLMVIAPELLCGLIPPNSFARFRGESGRTMASARTKLFLRARRACKRRNCSVASAEKRAGTSLEPAFARSPGRLWTPCRSAAGAPCQQRGGTGRHRKDASSASEERPPIQRFISAVKLEQSKTERAASSAIILQCHHSSQLDQETIFVRDRSRQFGCDTWARP
jgi:hypothetical protein